MEWQPIKTVPKDGTPVDLWHKVGTRITDVWWEDTNDCWSCEWEDDSFTHWMPIPLPPTAD